MKTCFAFMYNSCVYESADACVSLHATKTGAWKAMRKFLWDNEVSNRESYLDILEHDPEFATLIGGYQDPVNYTRHYIKEMQILP
jgi:hypothetical protein